MFNATELHAVNGTSCKTSNSNCDANIVTGPKDDSDADPGQDVRSKSYPNDDGNLKRSISTTSEVTFCHFDRLLDDRKLINVLVKIFMYVPMSDLDACVRVCHAWRAFIGRHLVCAPDGRDILRRKKLPHDWLNGKAIVSQITITKNLAPPLQIYSDRKDIIMTTIDSILVWNRKNKEFKGEFGPDIKGSNHVMVQCLSYNSQIMATLHKHHSLLLVWNRINYRIIQELPCIGIDGQENSALYVKVRDTDAFVWQEDGSIVVYSVLRDGSMKKRQTLNGHIQGCSSPACDGSSLLTASADSKINLWDLDSCKLVWSNSRSDARFTRAALSADRAAAAGSYDQEGYLQLYDRLNGDIVHEMLTMEGHGFQEVALTKDRLIALLCIKHKLLTCKALILDSTTGDILSEESFVDVLHLNIVLDRVVVLVHNQVGDFRTRIAAFDLDVKDNNGNVFCNERVLHQYEHNYYRLPVCLDETSVIHTSEGRSDLVVRDFDAFFRQFDDRRQLMTPLQRRRVSRSTLCHRLRQVLFKKLCAKCVIM